ncbi:MAG: hypothetical protein IID42_08120 [Planctomycetes bacterium]|nr:hypothetical protein [Planctomycetota bacterium]
MARDHQATMHHQGVRCFRVAARLVDAAIPPLSVLIQVLLGLDLVTREQGLILGAAFVALLAAGASCAFVNGFDHR